MVPRHILIPLDRDAQAEQTLAYAIPLAVALQAAVTLLHVVEAPVFQGWGDNFPLESVVDLPSPLHCDAEVQCFMGEKLGRVRAAGLRGHSVILTGTPFQMIVNVAQARSTDLIIMGSHGRTGLRHLMLGSVAERVVRLAPCPVLVVREASCAALRAVVRSW
ncbi:MAG: universal stress protein [Candidatus Tectimicrobiota bacterium]